MDVSDVFKNVQTDIYQIVIEMYVLTYNIILVLIENKCNYI